MMSVETDNMCYTLTWFTLIMFISANVSFFDMMQGDNGNIKMVLGIISFINYLAIYLIYCCIVPL